VLVVITHSTTMAVTTVRNVGIDPAHVDAPARVRMRNQAEMKVTVAVNEAAMVYDLTGGVRAVTTALNPPLGGCLAAVAPMTM
jgi:hypothetical protein